MSEIREKAIAHIMEAIANNWHKPLKVIAEAIALVPEIAIVDREPEIMMESWFWENCRRNRKRRAKCCQVCPFIDIDTACLKNGLVKEVDKDCGKSNPGYVDLL